MINTYCKFCNKLLSEIKLEYEHGCLDCSGHIYIDNGKEVCRHCEIILGRKKENADSDYDVIKVLKNK